MKSQISLRKIVDLHPLHAASGLVKLGDSFYVIADDDLSLYCFDSNGKKFSERLIQVALPTDTKERKKQKSDWEALAYQQSKNHLWVIPSGSTTLRRQGFRVELGTGKVSDKKPIDFSKVYAKLESYFPELNIEGAAFHEQYLKLAQRGNGPSGINAIIDLDAETLEITDIKNFELGTLQGRTLGFTDICCYQDQLYFLAVAEDVASTYHDGKFLGAKLGCISDSHEIVFQNDLDCGVKPEGLWLEKNVFYIVTDADDPTKSSVLYQGNY